MKLYYYDAYLDESIDSSKPVEVSHSEAIEEFYNLTDYDGSFYGLIDDDQKTIQFAWVDQDKWLVDIPMPPDFVNPQQYADYDECIEIIDKIYSLNKVEVSNKMKIVNTMTETLDDIEKKTQ